MVRAIVRYIIQHDAVLTIFPFIIQTIVTELI